MRVVAIILTFLSIFTHTAYADDSEQGLVTFLRQKSDNYQKLHTYYLALLDTVKAGQETQFCNNVQDNLPLLNGIFEDDWILIKALRTFSDIDYQEYATQLEENSMTPLFSSAAFLDLCASDRRQDVLKLGGSLLGHVTNIDYLDTLNILFMQTQGVSGVPRHL